MWCPRVILGVGLVGMWQASSIASQRSSYLNSIDIEMFWSKMNVFGHTVCDYSVLIRRTYNIFACKWYILWSSIFIMIQRELALLHSQYCHYCWAGKARSTCFISPCLVNHICRWIEEAMHSSAHVALWGYTRSCSTLVKVVACRLFDTTPLPKPIPNCYFGMVEIILFIIFFFIYILS